MIAILIALPVLTGCLPRQVVVHDGIRASVVDAESKGRDCRRIRLRRAR
ncbi:hypothetical protein ACF3M1_02270 [Luteimonas sp. WGS1318]